MRYILTIVFLILFSVSSQAQNSINIIASGTAFTKEKATFSALRNALEKGAGVYISSKTVIQNDQLVFDEISSLANGTISKYDVIESNFSDKLREYQVTVNATIEVGKFVSLIKSKGVNVAFEGASFAQNVKMHEYYKEEEPKILAHFFDQYGWEEIFQLFDKKLIADEPKLYNFKSSDFQIGLEKDWKKQKNDQLINEVRNGRDVVLEINKKQYYNPFYIRFLSPKFSFDGQDFRVKSDSISAVIESWKELFKNKKNWTSEEITNYSKMSAERINNIYNWNDYSQYKLIDSMNKRFTKFQDQLRNRNGQYVINLVPELNTNTNYKTFIDSFKKILLEISVNKDNNFSQSSYEEKFGKTYSIYLFELNDGKYKKHEFVLRNFESATLYSQFCQMIGAVFSGNALIEFNAIKTNVGPINNYLSGLNLELNPSKIDFFFNNENHGLILNPAKNQYPTADLSNNSIESGQVPKYSLIQFADLETLGKIKEFTIDNPPTIYILPARPEEFLVDKAKVLSVIQKKSLQDKLNNFANKTGAELFIVLDNNNYGIDDLKDLTGQYGFEWQIGGKERKGVILLINNKTRKIFYRYGGGLDSQLTEKYSKEIIESFKPFLKAGNYLGGFNKAIELTETKILPIKK